jgi:hypothetical protein
MYVVQDSGQLINPATHIIIPDIREDIECRDYFQRHGITFPVLNELERIGLINYGNIAGFILKIESSDYPKIMIQLDSYSKLILEYPNEAFPMGSVMLTNAGSSIAQVIQKKPTSEHFEHIVKYLEKSGVRFQ